MSYTTYGPDMRRAWSKFRNPAKNYGKSVAKTHDPFKLLGPTTTFVAQGIGFAAKMLFFTTRKALNR